MKQEFIKVADTERSIVIGLIDGLTEDTLNYDKILEIAASYNINTELDKFTYHFITADGAIKRGCKDPVENFNGFLEIFN